jgi:hypothetical protein
MMIYGFDIVGGAEVTAPAVAPHITEPLWKLCYARMQDYGALSEGLSNEIDTYFVVKARNLHWPIVPHNRNQVPHFCRLMEFDPPRHPIYVLDSRNHYPAMDRLTTRLSFSRGKRGADNVGSSPASICGVISRLSHHMYLWEANSTIGPGDGVHSRETVSGSLIQL